MQAQLDTLNSKLAGDPAVAAEQSQIENDYQVLKDQYAKLLQDRETIKLRGQAQSQTDSIKFSVIDPPNAPRVRPNAFGRWFGRTLLRLGGLRMVGEFPDLPRVVLIGAPHSSNWDGVWGFGAKLALGLDINDVTSGYRAYRASVLRTVDHESTQATGFGFQIELTARVARCGAHVTEVPIVFTDRTRGKSKMSARITAEALALVTWWAVRDRVVRRHARPVVRETDVEVPAAA